MKLDLLLGTMLRMKLGGFDFCFKSSVMSPVTEILGRWGQSSCSSWLSCWKRMTAEISPSRFRAGDTEKMNSSREFCEFFCGSFDDVGILFLWDFLSMALTYFAS